VGGLQKKELWKNSPRVKESRNTKKTQKAHRNTIMIPRVSVAKPGQKNQQKTFCEAGSQNKCPRKKELVQP